MGTVLVVLLAGAAAVGAAVHRVIEARAWVRWVLAAAAGTGAGFLVAAWTAAFYFMHCAD